MHHSITSPLSSSFVPRIFVDFYVQKAIVAEASPVFAGMFTIRIPEVALAGTSQQDPAGSSGSNEQLYRDGVPIASVLESSTVLDGLLRFCYPTGPPELSKVTTVCDILDAARKYMMDPIADYLLKHFVSRAEKEPFQVYALAASRGLEEEMELAAFQSLRLQFPIGTCVPETASMSVQDYVRLQKYHHRCRTHCETTFLRVWPKEVNAIFSSVFWTDPAHVPERWGISQEEWGPDWWFEQCNNRKQGGKVVAKRGFPPNYDGIKSWNAPQWLMEYLAEIRSLLRQDPRKDALLQSNLLARFSERACKCCNACCHNVMSGSLRSLHGNIAKEFELSLTSTVYLFSPRGSTAELAYSIVDERLE